MKRKIGEPFGRSDSNSALFQIAEIIRKAGMVDHPGDSILAHISPEEARILKKRGGAGRKNPRTGALSFYEEGNDDNDNYGGRDEGDRGRAAAESGGAGGFGAGSMGGDGGQSGGVNYGEEYGPSYADLGIEAGGYGPSVAEFGGSYPSAPEPLSGRDAYGPTAGPGGMPANGNVYAGYNPDPLSFGEKYGGGIMGIAGSLFGGPVAGVAGKALGDSLFGRPEQGSLIGRGYGDDETQAGDVSALDSSMGMRGVNTPQGSAYFNDQGGALGSVGAQEIVQAMPQTVIQPAAPVVSPWRTYQPPQINWATYGEGPGQSFYDRVNPLTNKFAGGGTIPHAPLRMASGGALMGLVDGPGDGESDSVPVQMPSGEGGALSGGEYVIPAADVAAFGNGSSMAGARAIDSMLMNVRRAHIDHLSQKPPPRR